MDTDRQNLLAIGTFANAVGLSLKALRLYDQLGILSAAYTDPDSGYRYYQPDQVPAARLIRLMRSMDMPLALIREVLAAPPEEAREIVGRYRKAVEAHAVLVRRAAWDLMAQLNKETKMPFEVEVRDVPQTQVVSITQQITVEALSRYIKGSLGRLGEFVQAQGGETAGAPLGIFHGPVTQTDDGPMEVCFPVRGSFTAEGDVVVKELPGGRAATVTAVGEQCDFPAILGAYDTAFDWITRNGFVPAGPPREVWEGQDEKGPMVITVLFQDKE